MTVEERLSPECTICGSKKNLVRDHCHRTGFVRGILCSLCNTYLGTLEGSRRRRKNWYKWYNRYEDKINIFRRYHVSIPYESFASKQILFMLRDLGRQQAASRYKSDTMYEFLERINIVQ